MNKRIMKKHYKEFVTTLANDGRKFKDNGKEFKAKECKRLWIRDTVNGWGTSFTKFYLEGN